MFSAMAAVLGIISAPAMATGPHWTHDEQAEWGAIVDTAQSVIPLTYPYAGCVIGTHQSPVNLAGKGITLKHNGLKPAYVDDAPDFFNSGHAIQVNTSTGYKGQLWIGSDRYPLIQYHFHTPSEHVIGTKSHAAELHYVHVRPDGKMAVLGVFIKEGAANPNFQTILDNIPAEEGTHNVNGSLSLNPAALLPTRRTNFYTYAGSLTTPPCSEGIAWYVLAEPITFSAEQLVALKALYDRNIRLPQPLNGRVVTHHR
jgi:carbonic anhydrase